MSQQEAPRTTRRERTPREGCFFTGIRALGIVFQITGLLLAVLSVVGFGINLVRLWPTLTSAWQYSEQRMAGFVLLASIGVLLAFVIFGLVGAFIAGIGLLLTRASMGSASPDEARAPAPSAASEEQGNAGPAAG